MSGERMSGERMSVTQTNKTKQKLATPTIPFSP